MPSIFEANQIAFNKVEGWVGDRIYQIIEFAQQYHEANRIRGDIAEIGVHHGKMFFIMAAAARTDESCIAIDLFNDQSLNVDKSGRGDRAVFDMHLDTRFPHIKDRVRVVTADSMSITPAMAHEKISMRGVRLFSVDGGHTVGHVINDLSLAQELLVPSGITLLDDFFGPLWPSVTEGFFAYMDRANRRLAPFLIFQNKIFLTTFSEHQGMLQGIRDFAARTVGDEIHFRWRNASLCGHDVLCFA